MVIWCISKYACPPKYGSGSRLFYLAKEFNQLGHETIIFTSDANHLAKFPVTNKKYNYEDIEGVHVCWLKTKKYTKTASVTRVLSWFDFEFGLFRLKRNDFPTPEVIIVSSLSLLSIIYGYYLKKRYKSFLVFEVRDIWPLTMVEEGGSSRWHPLVIFLGIIEKFGYKKADLIVGTMPKLDLHVKETIGYERPFFCSPLGYSNKSNVASNEKTNKKLETYFPEGKVIIGYAGSMGISNALTTFVQCIEELSEYEKIHFVLVGSGDLQEKYKVQLKNNNNVTFVPRINSEEVKSFLQYCDILYLSTHDSKVWLYGQSMNKLVEYMMAAKPIIASYSGYQSMLNESNAGKFVPSNDLTSLKKTIIEYASMPHESRKSIGDKGRRWILNNRSYSQLAKDYINKIESLKV